MTFTLPRPTSLLLALALLPACLVPCQAQPPQALEMPAGSIAVDRGVIVAAHNRLTGETYIAAGTPDRGTGILRPGTQSAWSETATCRTLPGDAVRSIASEAKWTDGSALVTTAGASPDGDFVVHQTAQASAPGVWGCQWGIAGISEAQASLIVPLWSGVRFRKGAPFQEGVLDWPTAWEAQLLIVQGLKGGMWIHADDPQDRFKGVSIRRHSGVVDLGFRTYNEGPPADHRTAESVTWRIGFYKGDWRVPARQFRDWMARTAGLTSLAQQQPAWVGGIRSVVILQTSPTPKALEETRAVLTKLKDWVTPSKTLLYTPGWRRDTYDISYPDYTAHEGFKELVEFAHKLGYRVMPHTCYYGVNLENPEYQPLKPYHMRDALSGDLITYEWKYSDPVPHIAMIHPGAKAYRDLYVRKLREAVERYSVDAFHLDVTLVMPNVTQRADGFDTIGGNGAFHRDLHAALPQIALGGEGLNEVSCRREAFAQVHGGFAINMGSGPERIANDAGIDCSHPISAYLLSPFTHWYGYLGYPPPDASPLYRGWTRAYESWGVAPTLSSPSLAGLQHPGPDLRARLEEMRLVDRYDLKPDFDASPNPQTKCVWRGPSGAKLVYDRDEHGGSHVWFAEASGQPRTIYRYLRGSTVFLGEGTVGQCAAYDDRGIYGLDPGRTYLCTPEPRPTDEPRLMRLPEGTIARGLRSSADFMLFDLATRPQGFDLRQAIGEASLGITVAGQDHPLGSQAQVVATGASCGGKTKDVLFAHPPWDTEHGVIGEAFAEWTVKVPDGARPALDFAFGLRDGAEKGDGVTFAVRVDGKELLRQDWKLCEWLPCHVDLSPYMGRTIKLRFSVGKGPEGRGSFAWALWGEPRIVTDPLPKPLGVDVLTPAKAWAATGPVLPPVLAFLRPEGKLFRHHVETATPGATCLFFGRPAPASLPLDLRTAPFTWTTVVDGMAIPVSERPAYAIATPGEGISGGVTRPGLVAHPPIGGATVADYVIALPKDKPAQLRFSAGIQEGAKGTNGVAFIVTVNGQVVSRQEIAGSDGWHEGTVDLSAHAGKTILLSLIADAMGDASYDWARWGEPRIEAK